MENTDRIFFKNNPYPNGHKIKNFVWSGRLDPQNGLWFDFHLETENYYAEDNGDDPEAGATESDWQAKIAWENFHSCKMSSTEWHFGGILVANRDKRLDFENLEAKRLMADRLPLPMGYDYEDLAFHIYLLGHDTCADHEITFLKKRSNNSFDIRWTGKIALTYIGEDDFKYEFAANLKDVTFSGFEIPEELSSSTEIKESFKNFVVNPYIFQFVDGKIKAKD